MQAGSTIVTQHFRGDQELPPLGVRRFWDFNFQPMAAVPPSTADLLPGDSLVTSCSFDTTGRTIPTKWVARLPMSPSQQQLATSVF